MVNAPFTLVQLACNSGSLANIATPGVFSGIAFTGCSFTQHRRMSHSTCAGASVFTASGLQCAGETRYPALMSADRKSAIGGGVTRRQCDMECMS